MFAQKKPYSAVTVTIENLTAESYPEDDFSGIPDLVEVIKLQASGPTEAARAIRKKLKYGSPHRQIRALVLLDGLIQNAGPHFQRTFADEPLLERLRVCGSAELSDAAVRKKCAELFREWAQYGGTPGLERVAKLYKELPKRKVAVTQQSSKVIRETENPFGDEEEEEAEMRARQQQQQQQAAGPSSSSGAGFTPDYAAAMQAKDHPSMFGKKSKSKNKSGKGFDLEAEKEKMKAVIAEASIASTNLVNTMQSINREKERVSDNPVVAKHFEACKMLRRRILRYIHHVTAEQWLGSLLHANDELVHALLAFEQLDQSIDADSDSDDELAEQAHMYRMVTQKAQEERAGTGGAAPDLAGLKIDAPPKPPRPAAPARNDSGLTASDEDEDDAVDDDNPFGDQNVVQTPMTERGPPRW